jgi:membrane protein YdbS with pleckstrin-like domain
MKNLGGNEEIVFKTRRHYIMLVWLTILSVLTAGIGLILGIFPLFVYFCNEFIVTQQRVKMKTGYLKMQTVEYLLTEIQSVSVKHGILGRALGYGTITMIMTDGTRTEFANISGAARFRKSILEAKILK